MVYGIGALARSKAGHDKDELYVITCESREYVVLVDGNKRSLEKPKCKNKKHIQIIHDNEEPQRKRLIEEAGLTDEAVRRFIKHATREKVRREAVCQKQTL